ncbi:MAG: hypothetical protein IPK97_05835 [Ahniella sp.]|nr:hypothetical protein [Ahniella sp.]
MFDHFLDTLTARKEEYQFEHFCRLIAEREICPNLRIQTGPTGGGDSKVDSENYPVASEIAERWWFGEPTGGAERWAFAFSAKKKWVPKLKADVASILSTQRPYSRIYFFTNQLVSDRVRAKTEDALTKSAGIPVHIFDRNQLSHFVYEKGYLDLAVRALHIEDVPVETVKLGSLDTARREELLQLDAQIADPARYEGARYQLVEDCIRGAILARTLERERYEIEGRFSAAERIAVGVGLTSQQLRLAYFRAWTAFWWYEDVGEFLTHYDVVEQLSVHSNESEDLARLCTLYQLLMSAERLKQVAPEKSRVRTSLRYRR